jgi:F-box-like
MSQSVSSKSLCPPICSQTNESIGLSINTRYRDSPIHILNNDVLLNIFHLYRLENPDEFESECGVFITWSRQGWWYKLAHVCRLWRSLILESPSLLDLHL